MKETLVTGKSTSKLISAFMKKNNLDLNDFKFEVVEEGSSGFLGLGSKPTTIKFVYDDTKVKINNIKPEQVKNASKKQNIPKSDLKNAKDVSNLIKDFAEGILARMNIESSTVNVILEGKTYYVNISNAQEAGFLIGKEAKLLNSFQHLLNQMVNKSEKRKIRLLVDIDGYRERRTKALLEKVENLSQKVKDKGRSYTMEPLPASTRKVVHQFVEKDSKLRTRTIGEGSRKRVVILPVKKADNSKKSSKKE
ncbi:MAG: Jag N-terminal domain-containing protein [Candidatus Cloacimonetes bacterium]|nr:Jag N-terminal domain-containing protein [Candidatus Cloacimonadota bacterium]